MVYRWAIIGWMHLDRILIDFILCLTSKCSQHVMPLSPLWRVQGSRCMLSLICMDMLIKKVAFCSAIPLITQDFKSKVYFLQNICQRSVSSSSLNPVISVKSKWHQKTKVKIFQNKVVPGWSFINGRILPTVIL